MFYVDKNVSFSVKGVNEGNLAALQGGKANRCRSETLQIHRAAFTKSVSGVNFLSLEIMVPYFFS